LRLVVSFFVIGNRFTRGEKVNRVITIADTINMKRLSFFLILLVIAVIAPAQTISAFRQEGLASWYGEEFAGRPTASGEIFNPALLTAAHPTLPFGTILTVTNMQNMRQVTVRVNDRGPFVSGRIIDISMAAAEALGMQYRVAPVLVEGVIEQVMTFAPPPLLAPPPLAAITPPARVLGGIPPASSTRLYRIQVGAYSVPKNAVDVFVRLRNAGLNPAYDPGGGFFRVILGGLRAVEIPAIAQTLGNAGFQEVMIRAE